MKPNHKEVQCFHCKKIFNQRIDTIKRQYSKYNHSCCKKCFGKEDSFKNARKRVMTHNNPFKGKRHTEKTKQKLSLSKIGSKAWNKGLDISDARVMKYAIKIKKTKHTQDTKGSKNSNWKGGSDILTKKNELFLLWLPFRECIIKRDGMICSKCKNVFKKSNLHVHHLKSKSKYPYLKYDVHNCVTMCKNCHTKFHHIYGTINFTKSNYHDYIAQGKPKYIQFSHL